MCKKLNIYIYLYIKLQTPSMSRTPVKPYYCRVKGDSLYPPTSRETLTPSFTKTIIKLPSGSITFFVRESTVMSTEMIKVMDYHSKFALPDESGGIPHCND